METWQKLDTALDKVMKTLEDYQYDFDERAAIEHENNAIQFERARSKQAESKRIRNELIANGMSFIEAAMAVKRMQQQPRKE